jgi:hypothetical protein
MTLLALFLPSKAKQSPKSHYRKSTLNKGVGIFLFTILIPFTIAELAMWLFFSTKKSHSSHSAG